MKRDVSARGFPVDLRDVDAIFLELEVLVDRPQPGQRLNQRRRGQPREGVAYFERLAPETPQDEWSVPLLHVRVHVQLRSEAPLGARGHGARLVHLSVAR